MATASPRTWRCVPSRSFFSNALATGALDALGTAAASDASPHGALADLACAFNGANQPDSAAATFLRYVDTPGLRRIDRDAMFLRRALETAARFLRANGHVADAARYEARVAALPERSS